MKTQLLGTCLHFSFSQVKLGRTVAHSHFSHFQVFLFCLEVGKGRGKLNNLIAKRGQLFFLSKLVDASTGLGDIPVENDVLFGESGHLVAKTDREETIDVRVESIASLSLSLASEDVHTSRSIYLVIATFQKEVKVRRSEVKWALRYHTEWRGAPGPLSCQTAAVRVD